MTLRLTHCLIAFALGTALSAQAPPAPGVINPLTDLGIPDGTGKEVPQRLASGPSHIVVRYPEDQARAIAVVGSRTLTLGDLVDHIDSRHYPGFKGLLVEQPSFQRYLTSDLMAAWVRLFADLEALRQSLGDQKVDPKALEAAQSEALRKNFQTWLDAYVADRKQAGRSTELSQNRVNRLLSDFQLRSGIAAELQGFLDVLEPDDWPRGVMQDFFNDNARAFGGQVTIAHILVQHRDAGTGLMLNDEGQARANARIADIKARLRPDGSNFEEIARLYSDDTRTAAEGGRMTGIHRYDDRLPATLCRAAWDLRDGEMSTEVVETPYGWHLIKRLEFAQQVFILFTDDAIPSIKVVMRRALQEKRMFGAREKAGVRLLL